VNAEDFTVDERGQSEVVEDLATVLPCVGVSVFLLDFIVKTVYLGDLSALVITAQQGDLVGISGFKKKEISECLETVISSVYKISHENVVCFCQVASSSEKLEKIEELTVNVTTDGNGAAHGLDVRLLQKILLHQIAELL